MSKIPDKKRIEELSEKWLNGTISKREQKEYDLWYGSFEDHEVYDLSETDFDQTQDRIYQSIQEREVLKGQPGERNLPRRKPVYAALIAASVALFMVAASYFQQSILRDANEKQDFYYSAILPGKDKATLRIANGALFDLDSLKNGEVFQESGVRIEKSESGELVYSVLNASTRRQEIIMNTVSTPKGGQYKINLPDGSRVWLNAASELTFPTVFDGQDRKVELVGEAYFEVARNEKQPFRVVTQQEEVEVLGTHFNVSSYRNEGSSVALLEGKVKVSLSSSRFVFLNPGQQSLVQSGSMNVFPVDPSEAVAWKNGEFMFSNENIKSVMSKVARWYDVEVVLAPELEDIAIWGTISKYENIKEVLKIIEMTGSVHFRIEGRRIYVMV